MPPQLGQHFRERLSKAEAALQSITEATASGVDSKGVWTRRQVLGHLLDSAANNHIRFVDAAINGEYSGPKYDSDEWVRLHDYANLSWSFLLEQWHVRNVMLAQVVDHIPEDKLAAQCTIGEDKPVTLKFVIEDYLDHLDSHVSEIISRATAA